MGRARAWREHDGIGVGVGIEEVKNTCSCELKVVRGGRRRRRRGSEEGMTEIMKVDVEERGGW